MNGKQPPPNDLGRRLSVAENDIEHLEKAVVSIGEDLKKQEAKLESILRLVWSVLAGIVITLIAVILRSRGL